MGASPSPDPASQLLGAGLGIITSLLGAHVARLRGAKNENAAIPAAYQSLDADLAQIQSDYNNGNQDAASIVNALQAMNGQIYQYLHSLVGAPGTAWTYNGAPGSALCDKGCTAACCVYNQDIAPSISNVIAAIQQAESSGSGVAKVRTISTSKYATWPSRPGYSLQFTKPPFEEAALSSVMGTFSGFFGGSTNSSNLNPAPPQSGLKKLAIGAVLFLAAIVGIKAVTK